jgi:hypothetical protein
LGDEEEEDEEEGVGGGEEELDYTAIHDCPAHSLVAILNELLHLLYCPQISCVMANGVNMICCLEF